MALACTPAPVDGHRGGDELAWAVDITDGPSRLPDSCTTAVASFIRALETKSQHKVEIVAYAAAPGSASLELARLSSLAGQLREAILQGSGKMKIQIETRLLPALGGETRAPTVGRILLRAINRRP